MTSKSCTTSPVVRVAIDVAKLTHQVLLELPSGTRRVLRVANTKAEIDRFVATLRALELSCEIAFEPTGDYHRPLAYLARTGRLSSLLGVVDCRRSHTRSPVQLLGQERSERRAGHSAFAEEWDNAAVSGSAHDRVSGPAGDSQDVSADLPAKGAATAQSGHAPLAAVFSRGRALSAQLPGRMVYRVAALYAVPHRRTALHQDRVCRRGPRANRWTEGRQGPMARRLL